MSTSDTFSGTLETSLTLSASHTIGTHMIATFAAGALLSISLSNLSGEAAVIDATLPELSLSATMLSGRLGEVDAVLPRLSAQIGSAHDLSLTLPSLSLSAEALTGMSGRMIANLPRLSISATNLAGTIASPSLTLPKLLLSAASINGRLGTFAVTLPKLTSAATGYTGTLATVNTVLPFLSLDASNATGQLSHFDGTLPSLFLQAVASTQVSVATITAPHLASGVVSLCYVMNMKSFGLTSYSGFPADSIAIFQGKLLRADSTGIWEQSGELNDTAEIVCNLKTGLSDMNDPMTKRIPEIAIDMRGDEQTRVKVSTDQGQEYTYRVERFHAGGMHQNRVKPGKALKSKYYAIEVENYKGDDLMLAAIKPLPLATQRKVG